MQLPQDESPTYFIRSGLFQFLTACSHHYELVLFTAALKVYADYFLERLDPSKLFSHVLHRDHCEMLQDGSVIKNLARLGRDLATVVIVDNLEENFRLQQENGIVVPDFVDDFEDRWLYVLADFFVKMAKNRVTDLREVLSEYRDRYQDY
jgi:TFIIF-interacting CTD phosphatase-like protein